MRVELVASTHGEGKYAELNQEEITSAIARHGIIKEDNGKLVKYLMTEKHWSPLDMVNFVFEIETSRAIGRQILRHASIKFQEHCITGDSKITTTTKSGRTQKIEISKLYDRFNNSYWKRGDNLVRVFDSKNNCFKSAKIKEVFKNGINEVYEITLSNGKKIKSTMSHKFFQHQKGFVRLKELSIGDFIATNGVAVHQSKEWMQTAKDESFNFNGVNYIADKAGVSYHTIRKWLRIHELQYSRHEVAKYTEIWNKGLPSNKQPNYNRMVSQQTRQKLRESLNEKSLLNIKERTGNRHFEQTCRDFSAKYKNHLKILQHGRCAISGDLLENDFEVDHIKPVKLYPDLAFELSNLQAVNKSCHKDKTTIESRLIRNTVRYSQIINIEYVGEDMTYDLEVDNEDHNYIANGILVHNSQRYSESAMFEDFDLRKEHPTNRQSSTESFDPALKDVWETPISAKSEITRVLNDVEELYNALIEAGVAKECARMILPECTTTTMTANGTLRSWLSFLNVRQDHHSQLEVQEISTLIGEALEKKMPNVFKTINWRNGMFM